MVKRIFGYVVDGLAGVVYYVAAAGRCVSAQVHYLKGGRRIADFELQNARRAVCEGCDFRDGLKCGECGCFLREKVEMERNVCPMDLWPEDED